MKHPRYVAIVAVAIASLLGALLLPHGELVQTLASIPLFGALLAAVFEIFRDQARRQHEQDLAANQNRFTLAAGSHMASTAFDKHVAFCEEYISEVYTTLSTLFREGPTKKALDHANTLGTIKRKHGLWVTHELEAGLAPFEQALRKVGAAQYVEQEFPKSEGSATRRDEMYRHFAKVLGTEHMGAEWNGQPITDEAAIARVVDHLRGVLGIDELTRLRSAVIRKAKESLE